MANHTTPGLIFSLLAISIATACATGGQPPGTDASTPSVSAPPPMETLDDLAKVDIGRDGELFMRPDHQIGGFDAVHFPLARIGYRDGSPELTPRAENEFLGLLEQSLVDDAEGRGFEVADRGGKCVLQMQISIDDVNITQRRRTGGAGDWATLTFVIELRESLSGRPLARYSKDERIMSPGTGENRAELILANYAAILEEIDLPGVVTGATAVPSPPREGCDGSIARVARTEPN